MAREGSNYPVPPPERDYGFQTGHGLALAAVGPAYLACKAFPEWAEPDLEIGDDFLWIFAVDSRAAASGHE